MNDLEPSEFYLSQNHPNPFSEKTTIKFCVAYKCKVRLEVFNLLGEIIKTILDEEKESGTYEAEFDSSSCHSGECLILPEGTYFYRLQAGEFISTKKMLKLKIPMVNNVEQIG